MMGKKVVVRCPFCGADMGYEGDIESVEAGIVTTEGESLTVRLMICQECGSAGFFLNNHDYVELN